ncbi:MAG: hypothetical protein HY674_08315 [Chloroflexi bacterium]|nr:hypothetical protein [Chloroflexota bacterium]
MANARYSLVETDTHHALIVRQGIATFRALTIPQGTVVFEISVTNSLIRPDLTESVKYFTSVHEAGTNDLWMDNLYLRVESAPTVSALVPNNTGGTVTKSPSKDTYTYGETVTLTATPKRYYTFLNWSDGVLDAQRSVVVGLTNNYVAIFTNTVPLELVPVKNLVLSFDVFGTFAFGGNDSSMFMRRTADGGFIMAGGANQPSTPAPPFTAVPYGGRDFSIIKLDAGGNVLWDKDYGGSGNEWLYDAQTTSHGGFILVGETLSDITGNKTTPNFGTNDAWVVKLNSLGNKEWDQTFGGSSNDVAFAVHQTIDGGYLVGGFSESGADGNKTSTGKGAWLLRLDASGNKLWEKTYGQTRLYDGVFPIEEDSIKRILPAADGGFYLGASTYQNDLTLPRLGQYDYWLMKVDAAGNLVWEKFFGTWSDDRLYDFIPTGESGLALIGSGYSYSDSSPPEVRGNKALPGFGDWDFWMVLTDNNGNKVAERAMGGTALETAYSGFQMPDGGFVLGGVSGSGVGGTKTTPWLGSGDGWVVRIAVNGTQLYDFVYGNDFVYGRTTD